MQSNIHEIYGSICGSKCGSGFDWSTFVLTVVMALSMSHFPCQSQGSCTLEEKTTCKGVPERG